MARKQARELAPGDRIVGRGEVVAVDGPPQHVRGYGWFNAEEGLGETVVVKQDDEEVEVEEA